MEEYFVSYYETIFPGCHQVFENDYEGIQSQKGKTCFSSCCDDCKANRSYCTGNCHDEPYACSTVPCPESERKLSLRTSIGRLTSKEIETFKALTRIDDIDNADIISASEIGSLSDVDKVLHLRAIKAFDKELGRRSKPYWDVPF